MSREKRARPFVEVALLGSARSGPAPAWLPGCRSTYGAVTEQKAWTVAIQHHAASCRQDEVRQNELTELLDNLARGTLAVFQIDDHMVNPDLLQAFQ